MEGLLRNAPLDTSALLHPLQFQRVQLISPRQDYDVRNQQSLPCSAATGRVVYLLPSTLTALLSRWSASRLPQMKRLAWQSRPIVISHYVRLFAGVLTPMTTPHRLMRGTWQHASSGRMLLCPRFSRMVLSLRPLIARSYLLRSLRQALDRSSSSLRLLRSFLSRPRSLGDHLRGRTASYPPLMYRLFLRSRPAGTPRTRGLRVPRLYLRSRWSTSPLKLKWARLRP